MSAMAPELPTREEVLAQAPAENFTVASFVLGRERQRHLMAIYGFARLVDDVGDEVGGRPRRAARRDRGASWIGSTPAAAPSTA